MRMRSCSLPRRSAKKPNKNTQGGRQAVNKSESKYFNTALRMDEALISLLKVKDLEYITVKEICENAGVNRSTFYLHYETIGDLVEEAIEMVNRRFISCFSEQTRGIAERLDHSSLSDLILITQDYLHPYLRFVSENKDLYRTAFRTPREMQAQTRYRYIKKYIMEPILKRFGIPEAYWRYYTVYYIEGIMAIVKEWLETDCRDPVEMVAAVIEECVSPNHNAQGRMCSTPYATPDDPKVPKAME